MQTKTAENEVLNTCVYGENADVAARVRDIWRTMGKKEKSEFSLDMVSKYRVNASTLQKKLCGHYELTGTEISAVAAELAARGYAI